MTKSNFVLGELVAQERALVVPADIGVDAAHGEVHPAQAPGRVVALLPIDGDVRAAALVVLDEPLGLDEHAARAAAWVVNAALAWLEHLDDGLDHRTGRVELAAAPALGAGELSR